MGGLPIPAPWRSEAPRDSSGCRVRSRRPLAGHLYAYDLSPEWPSGTAELGPLAAHRPRNVTSLDVASEVDAAAGRAPWLPIVAHVDFYIVWGREADGRAFLPERVIHLAASSSSSSERLQ